MELKLFAPLFQLDSWASEIVWLTIRHPFNLEQLRVSFVVVSDEVVCVHFVLDCKISLPAAMKQGEASHALTAYSAGEIDVA